MSKTIVLFDGVCNFCNGGVNFIIQRDSQRRFMFAPLQSEVALNILRAYQIRHMGDTFVVIRNQRAYVRSNAALEIVRDLPDLWRILYLFKLVPSPLRDAVYRILAHCRYRLFGKRDACMVPTEALRRHFLTH